MSVAIINFTTATNNLNLCVIYKHFSHFFFVKYRRQHINNKQEVDVVDVVEEVEEEVEEVEEEREE